MLPDHAADPLTRDLLAFIEAAPTPYHAVTEVAARLLLSGYRRFSERETWALGPGDRGFVVRGGGSIAAFRMGRKSPADAGFVIVGAHTDSPNLRLKPHAEQSAHGYEQLSVEVYGGVLLSTWLDRDLGLAGRVVLEDGSSHLVRLPGAFCRVPNLAIHLERDVNTAGLKLNAQNHLLPVAGFELPSAGLELRERLAAFVGEGIDPKLIRGTDLCLFDTQPPALGGARAELIFSARLDNLTSCHAALSALLAAGDADATRVVVLYDHEEVGSESAIGAGSQFLESVLSRLSASYPATSDAFARALAGSLLVSADMAHALHPNYPDKHDKQHRPLLGKGPVLKLNVNQRYATDGPTAARFRAACARVGVEPQHFVARNDMGCGSTIGPIAAAGLGLRTVDVGGPMLSMHSCREMAASADVPVMIRVLTALFDHFEPLDPAA
ncbi:MAG: putative aminopeptidase 2 [Polyangiaceae bacterium]|jgi:aspartyl aminopeptidase|nr:putative aminopeptidase 2 [Polyangiaceae bacterium]